MFNPSTIDTIVWDFDGVLNCNMVDGRIVWGDGFEAEFGHSFETFSEMIFADKFSEILIGEMNLMDAVADWAGTVGYHGDLRNILEFWFQSDYNLDNKVMGWLAASKRSNLRNVMGTNNEAMRTQFIAEDLGFAERMDRIFASGLMGVAKPDEVFFDMVSDELSIEPDAILLIDDRADNIEAAEACGWQVHWFDGQDYAGLQAKLEEVGALG
ncbi:MAG: HAD-IA family hydrolase [Paracoccaceae bacterium]